MNRVLRHCLVFAAVAFLIAFIGQTFLPQIGGTGTAWGLAPGWQRETGFWNLAMLVIVLGVLLKGDARSGRIIVSGLLVLGMLLGTNHLVAVMTAPLAWGHVIPMMVNYIGVLLGWIGLSRPDQGA